MLLPSKVGSVEIYWEFIETLHVKELEDCNHCLM
jgi:hypothetical protein